MPKVRHEAVVEILRNEPELVLLLLAYAGVRIRFGPRATVTIADTNLSDREADAVGKVKGLFSDSVLVFEGGTRKFVVIAEVQTERPGNDRFLSWPVYVANARYRHGCGTL